MPPIIDRLTPTAGWPGGTRADGSVVEGTLVIVLGRNFRPTPDMAGNEVSFAGSLGGRVPAAVEWASPDEVHYSADRSVATAATVPGGLDSPMAVALDASGNLFIADTDHHRIVRRTPAGVFSSWGTLGAGPGQFNLPSGVAVDPAGNVYVADTRNHRIQKFANDGSFLATWGHLGHGIGEFDMPVAVDVTVLAGLTFVYVADSNNHRVARSDGNGGMATQLLAPASTGRILGVCAPRGYGAVYASDPVNKRLLKWAWSGPFNGSFGPAGDPHGLAVVDLDVPLGLAQDFDGFVYVADQGARVVRKFDPIDPGFREIARFGLTIPVVPGPTPPLEFVDPVDLVVSDMKAVCVVDRARAQVVRYTPADSQELWVHVPAGAVSGNLEVRTDEGASTAWFQIWPQAATSVASAHLNQGLVEYPLVAGKKTVIRYEMQTDGASAFGTYFWGSPVTDSARCRVLKDGVDIGGVDGEPVFITGTGAAFATQVGFEIRFDIPPGWLADEADYRFDVTLSRTGAVPFSDVRSFSGHFRHRRSLDILASPVTHLRHDGTRVASGSMSPALFYVGNDVGHFLDWLDWSQLYSGYVHFNRLYPMAFSLSGIHEYGIWVNGAMHDGITSDDEVREMLEVLEQTRRRLNEDNGSSHDYMLGVLDRREVIAPQNWAGVTSDSHRAALITVGANASGNPGYEVGAIIGHELLHQYDVPEQGSRERASSAQAAWNSVNGEAVLDPVTLMYVPPAGSRSYPWNDDTAFAEVAAADHPGEYDTVFEALANPHPVAAARLPERRLAADERPADTRRSFTLLGRLTAGGAFERRASWIGRGDAPVTPQARSGNVWLVFFDGTGTELLRWRVAASFGLRTVAASGAPGRILPATALISVGVPFPDATARVELSFDGRTAWRVDVPTARQEVHLITPRGGEQVGPADVLSVRWSASHPLAAALDFTLEWSGDGGQTFRPLALGLTQTQCDWPAGLGSATGRARLRVIASDGFHQVSDTSDDLLVGDAMRRVVIARPRPGAVIPEGSALPLLAIASDLEAGARALDAGNTRWLLDGTVLLGLGNDLQVRELALTTPKGVVVAPLPTGPHLVRVEVLLGPGRTLSHEIPIQIAADSDRDGVPDDVERARGTSPTDPGDASSIAPRYPFGQWRMNGRRVMTLHQVTHLGAGQVWLEIGFVDASGAPLAGHRVQVVEDGLWRQADTDAQGRLQIRLGTMQSALIRLRASADRTRGFGACSVAVAAGSPVKETQVLAHAWIHHRRALWLLGRESQGAVVINGGRPMHIRGATGWSGQSPAMKAPALSHRVLGRLRMAPRVVKPGAEPDADTAPTGHAH